MRPAILHPELTQRVQSIVPDARIESMRLPNCDNLQLFLINADYPRGPIPDELAQNLMEQPFYWAFCWASGLVLARFIDAHPELVANKRVLDFGSGSGVVAIAAAKAGASLSIACDIDPLALSAVSANAELNNVKLQLADDFNAVESEVDVIVAADVLYDRENLTWLDTFIDAAPQVLIADSRIKHFDHPRYRRVGVEEALTLPDLDESQEFRWVSIYQSFLS